MRAEQPLPEPEPEAKPTSGMRAALIGTGAVSVMGVVVGVVTSGLLARALGPQGRGEYAAVLNWPNFLATLGLMGLNSGTVYFSAIDPEHADTWRANALWLTLMGWVVSSTACWFLMPWLLAVQSDATILSARIYGFVYGLGMAGWAIGTAWLQGLRDFGKWNALRISQVLLWLIVLACLVLFGVRSVRVLALSFGGIFVVLAPVALLLKRRHGNWAFDPKRARRLLEYGLPTLAASLPGQLNRRLDQLMMATFVRPEILGLYAAAMTFTIPLSVISSPVANIIMPSIASTHTASQKADLLGRTVRATTLVLLAAALGLMAVVPALVLVLFGWAFRAAIGPALVLVIASVFMGLTIVIEDSLLGLGRPGAILKAELAAFVLTALGLSATLGRWPLAGAAATSLTAYAVSLWLIVRECKKALGLSPKDLLCPGRSEWTLLWNWLRSAIRKNRATHRPGDA